MKSQPGPPMTLGNAAAARVRLIVWCRECTHQVEPDPAEMAARYGAETSEGVTGWSAPKTCCSAGIGAPDSCRPLLIYGLKTLFVLPPSGGEEEMTCWSVSIRVGNVKQVGQG
jgi:hypothetical protein